jgi:uncharacterized membrane protein
MSFLIGYMLVVFAFYLSFDSESYTQVFLLILGVTGVFASNPLALFFIKGSEIRISDHVLMAVFTACYRLFILIQLELLRSHNSSVKTWVTVVLGIVFGLYATVDAAASYDRATHVASSEVIVPIVLQTEYALMACHAVYLLASVIHVVIAIIQNAGANTRRIVFFGISLAVTGVVTGICQIYFVLVNKNMYSVVPQMLLSSVHVTLAAITLFLLHSSSGAEYRPMDDSKQQQEAGMILDINDPDDDDEEDAGDDDDEEEDEE